MTQLLSILKRFLPRRARRAALLRRLGKVGAQPTIAHEFRAASIALALCLTAIIVAQLSQAVMRDADRAVLAQARADEDKAHHLSDATAEFRLAAVDLINDANSGHDAADRQAAMIGAVKSIRKDYVALARTLSGDGSVKAFHNFERVLGQIDAKRALVSSVNPATPISRREEIEDEIEAFNEDLELAQSALKEMAVERRRLKDAEIARHDKIAAIVVIGLILLSLGIGAYYYRRLVLGVFPAANLMRQSLVRMAHGHLDIQLPDQRFYEPQQMILGLRKLRASARREQQYALIDFLTDLPNRRALARALYEWKDGERGCLMIVDIDGFKLINDSFGHPVGDDLVRQIALRLRSAVPDIAMVARLGGDEFAILLPGMDRAEADGMAAMIVTECAEPIQARRTRLSITVSIGVTEIDCPPGQKLELSDVLKTADLALYAAKANGRNGHAMFTPDMLVASNLLHLIETDLDAAIASGGLHLAYQPIIAQNDREQEVEVLLRWNHPSMGAVSPEDLIDVAERSGQMERLGQWIIGKALDALSRWPHLSISLNLSPRQLRAQNFVTLLVGECRDRGIAPNRVMLEITESVAVDHSERTFLSLGLLQAAGFRIALDDFGKGYSSLWMLKQFSFDRLKIDRSLVEDVQHSQQARAILTAAVTMGRELDMEVVAEGVGNAALAGELARFGCTHLQGYWFSRPLAEDDVADYYVRPAAHWPMTG